MKWSILILSVPSRLGMMSRLYDSLYKQCREYDDIEILVLVDNKKRSIGRKRNDLLAMADGQYISFIDDDDLISNYYVRNIYPKLDEDADVIVFKQLAIDPDGSETLCEYGLGYDYEEGRGWWKGLPAHTMVWSNAIAHMCEFPNNNTEDYDWVKEASSYAENEVRLNFTLYTYRRNPKTTEIAEHKII